MGQFSMEISRCAGSALSGNQHIYYPSAIARPLPNWLGAKGSPFWAGLTEIEEIIHEIYTALHNNSPRLATMGIRALLEHAMVDKVGDHRSFEANMDEFEKAGWISANQRRHLKDLIEAGNAASHRTFKPDMDDVHAYLDLTESIICTVYVDPHRARGLAAKIPPRPPKPARVKA
ncbi:hypothetical protein CHELA1G11_10622 [Hyphomicrobiales bacterium]|nr:hypothetical protein CHELA1G11_10622 [Hyphomicrobiales bacterium]CAH1673378.1 hypothetical protein CHELA1G2_13681 [Hyphomicrobiales bacterium]